MFLQKCSSALSTTLLVVRALYKTYYLLFNGSLSRFYTVHVFVGCIICGLLVFSYLYQWLNWWHPKYFFFITICPIHFQMSTNHTPTHTIKCDHKLQGDLICGFSKVVGTLELKQNVYDPLGQSVCLGVLSTI